MDISNLAKEFAKIVKPEEKPVDVTLYGTTVISNGQLCVQLDGSDEITPAESTIEVAGGQRVAVLIKNHKAVITGSTTERAASSEDVDELYDQETIFNILTNNGQEQGLFLQNGKVYLNFSYAEGGTLKLGGASQNQYGVLELYDEYDNTAITMDSDGIKLYQAVPGTDIPKVQLSSDGLKISGDSEWFKYSGTVPTDYYSMTYKNSVEEVIFGTPGQPGISLDEVPASTFDGRHVTPPTSVGTKFYIGSNGAETSLYSKQTPISIKSTYAAPSTAGDYTTLTGSEVRVERNGLTLTGFEAGGQGTAVIDLDFDRTPSPIIYFSVGSGSTENTVELRLDKTLFSGGNVCLGSGKEFHGYAGSNEINLIAMSGNNNIVIGQTSNLNQYGDINLYAGTSQNSRIRLDSGNVLTTGTLSTGGTITSGGGLYTNGKTAVNDGTAGAAISTTGTIHLSASASPYIYFRYANSTSYYTRLAASNVTASRTLTMPNSTGTLAVSSSDIRIKENIKDSSVRALDLIDKIKLHEFDWKEEGRGGSPHWKCGIIADELEELDAELTSGGGYNEDGSLNVKSIDTLYLEGYIVKALQELSERIKKLEERT